MDGSAKAQAQHVLSGYKFGKNLGTGSFAEVKLAIHTLAGVQVAIKILDRQTVHAEKGIRFEIWNRFVRIMMMISVLAISSCYVLEQVARIFHMLLFSFHSHVNAFTFL